MANILLIEPDRILAEVYYNALVNEGNNVAVAAGAQTAVMSADRDLPDIIILELQLVEHSGIEFLYELRSYPEWQAIPIILHTNVPPAEFEQAINMLRDELSVAYYLYKPQTSLRQLGATVREQLALA